METTHISQTWSFVAITFYDTRQCYIDKLGQAIYEYDW